MMMIIKKKLKNKEYNLSFIYYIDYENKKYLNFILCYYLHSRMDKMTTKKSSKKE